MMLLSKSRTSDAPVASVVFSWLSFGSIVVTGTSVVFVKSINDVNRLWGLLQNIGYSVRMVYMKFVYPS